MYAFPLPGMWSMAVSSLRAIAIPPFINLAAYLNLKAKRTHSASSVIGTFRGKEWSFMKNIKRVLFSGLCAAALLATTACGNGAAPSASNATTGESTTQGSASVSANPGNVDLSQITVAVSLGWLENEAGMRQKQGYEETFKELGITNYSFVDANYDPVLQSEQINSIVQSKPDILIITPSDPKGIMQATNSAKEAGIPVFCSDGTVFGAEDAIVSEVIIDNYSGGYATMSYLCEKLGGKGKVGMIVLDANDSWNQRGMAAYDVLEKYPDIEVVAKWSWDSTGVITPRMAVDNFLVANPNVGDLDAIWCAWDGGCFEGIQACQSAGRTEIIFAGFDGGEEACNMILSDPQFVVCNGPAIYSQARQVVLNAVDYLNGKEVPKTSFATNILLTQEVLSRVTLEGGEKILDYDKPGMVEKWGMTVAPTIEH